MLHTLQLVVEASLASDESFLRKTAAKELNIPEVEISSLKIKKRSVDARSRIIKINLTLEVVSGSAPPPPIEIPLINYQFNPVHEKPAVIIVGAGPAGLFAALKLIELGVKPIIIERGKDVRERRRDLAAINKQHIVNPDSNYCFGEGGAGTYSDGKLYTRSTKRGDVKRILELLVLHGADQNILVEAHPHIGTNKLPKIIVAIREAILKYGGEILFNTRLVDFPIKDAAIKGVVTESVLTEEKKEFLVTDVILATGHSARDIFELLFKKGIQIEAKPFAMGVRIEHPQALIDSIQYHCTSLTEVERKRAYLPAASYSLVHQVKERGIYSFCMCPGGIIAPCATSPGEVVTNGWSPSKRNNPYANSGTVVAIELEDLKPYQKHGPLAGLRYQQDLEKSAWKAGGETQTAPAQRMTDFINKKLSSTLPDCSYQPGIKSVPLHEMLPYDISFRLKEGIKAFGQKMKGYLTEEAVLVGVESRTSSPVRIPRNNETLQHPQVQGLYPCGEGAGYAGGIISAAIDGERCAEKAAERVKLLKGFF